MSPQSFRHQSYAATVCALVSGGLDSAVMLERLLKKYARVVPLYIRCGLRWEPAELYWLRKLLKTFRSSKLLTLKIIDLPVRSLYGPHWSLTGQGIPSSSSADSAVYLPGRNVLLLSVAAIFCAERRISNLAFGILKGNPFADASVRFTRSLSSSLSQALRWPIRIQAPLRRFNKTQLIHSALPLSRGLTFSCLNPKGYRMCGRCNKCAERERAFKQAGVKEFLR